MMESVLGFCLYRPLLKVVHVLKSCHITTRSRVLVGQFKRCTAPAPVLKKDGREKSTNLHGVHEIVYI